MCEIIGFISAFAFGVIVGGFGLYYKLYEDIKDFEKKYGTLVFAITCKDEKQRKS